MKLWELPKRNIWVQTNDGVKFLFHNLDGMYSYCTLEDGTVFHPAAWTEVTLVQDSQDA